MDTIKKCRVCGKDFFTNYKKDRVNCSKKCQFEWQRIGHVGENSSNWRGGNVPVSCKVCGKTIHVSISVAKKRMFCSRKCDFKSRSAALAGINAPKWNGGIYISEKGYRLIYSPDHPYRGKGGYVREHRLVMEKQIGRILDQKEVVHHIDGNIKNNRIENLMLFKNQAEHLRHHKEVRAANH